jgi:hypothetical protein
MSWTLLSGGGLELGYRFSGQPSAVLHLDVLARSRTSMPSTALVGVLVPARAGRRAPPRRAARLLRRRIPQRLGIPDVQVDLMLSTLRPSADSAIGLAAEAGSQGSGSSG